MITIRRIVADEAEEFLSLLCGVFHLDIARARPVFYDNVLFELNRKWALFDGGTMCSILTTTGLTFGWGQCIGIAGVATRQGYERRGFGQRLLETVLSHAEADGEGPAMLFAHRETLYRRLGFAVTDEVVRGPIQSRRRIEDDSICTGPEVQDMYSKWSQQSRDRLVRTSDRWRYWGLSCRTCEPFLGGYACFEPGIVREAVILQPDDKWPVPPGSDWYGLREVTKACQVPLKKTSVELLFMTRNVPGRPQMFMTDQF